MIKLCLYKFWFMLLLFISFLFLLFGLYFLLDSYSLFLDWEVLTVNSSSLMMTFLFDWMSLIFMGSVLFISSMVILYSSSYMSGDMYMYRFLNLVLLFILSMMFLIISPNLISILLGWDGLGLVSYCLVIYFQSNKSYNAGMLTILTNRIGDVAILISIAWMFNNGSWHYIYYMSFSNNWYKWLFFLVILAAFTKSAQIPFSSWLPAAMAAPTPVSALVHSSTLVTAGVYLLIRFYDLITMYDTSYFLLLSLMTMFMAGLGANFEYDLKKIIALSTLSQLGMMMSILFMGYPFLSYFHLLTHAFFKALLFLCAGLIIHAMNDSQDIRHMGMLINQLPYTMSCYCISTLSLCGLPFLSGFYSKDMILESLTLSYTNLFFYIIFYLSVGLTASYSFRLIYYCLGSHNGLFGFGMISEDLIMSLSMILMTFMSVFSGSLFFWLFNYYPYLLFMPLECKLLAFIFVIMGSWIGYESSIFYFTEIGWGLKYPLPLIFMGNMWFMPYFSTYLMYTNLLFLSKTNMYLMDMGWGEYVVSSFFPRFMNNLSKLNSIYQFNNVKIYMLSFLLIGLFMIII
uniref:NADH dehydrogenase subunit 5 n=1 Tax=Dalcantha dilatata TaxID=1264647 RepID=UPI001D123CC8|nr:NADH dehydrogenase subunit 5 [Dalcantha dilatata]UCC45955.1 NADH dehydrogenase subunit 5 [Dalcantha dilatata]